MAALPREKILLGVALALAGLSAGVFGTLAWRDPRTTGLAVADAPPPSAEYTATVADAPVGKAQLWNPPVAQSRGRDWIYDTFTPPEIYYNPRSQLFTVKPPPGSGDETVAPPFGLELVAVRPEPFRLQLIGYVGEEGNWRGTFENLASGEVFLAAAGRSLPGLALSIRNLEVRTVAVALPDSMTTQQRVATAVVRDEQTGRDIILTHRARHFTGGLSALVAAPGETVPHELREGETLKLGDSAYRIEKIQLAPPRLDVTKESPSLTQPDRRTLAPRELEDAPLPPS